ncbi:MAG: hypothetical protein NTX03_03760 [Bacteroidetes bacterium]|nr:hypothetical protein [Bacteroidota bacterium]
MTNVATPIKVEELKTPSAENLKGIENHKTAAKHHEEAAKHHLDAAKHHEAGNHEKASESTIKAYGHHALASEHQKEDVKHHALNKSINTI